MGVGSGGENSRGPIIPKIDMYFHSLLPRDTLSPLGLCRQECHPQMGTLSFQNFDLSKLFFVKLACFRYCMPAIKKMNEYSYDLK